MTYFIHKQLIPGNNSIWVLKLYDTDTIDQFETLEEAKDYEFELNKNNESNRVYKVVIQNEDGTFQNA